MKPVREHGYAPNLADRDKAAVGPVSLERIAEGQERRRGYGKVIAAVALIAAAVAVGAYGRFAGLMTTAPTPSPAPTPITWISETAVPTSGVAPAEPASSLPPLPLTVQLSAPSSTYWIRGQTYHFTLVLANGTEEDLSLRPCPTYRIYLAGTDPSDAPVRFLNCPAMGATLQAGKWLTLDMAYTPAANDAVGKQNLVWQWLSPDSWQVVATLAVYIAPA